MSDIITAILIVSGGLFGLIGALGVVRLPDVLIRMHASTKIGTLSCGLIVAGAAVHFGTAEIVIRAVAIIFFLLLTAPIAAHMIGRAAVVTGVPLWQGGTDGASASKATHGDEDAAQPSDGPAGEIS